MAAKTMYDKVVIGFGVLFVIFMGMGAGIHLQKNEGFDFAFSLLAALFWVGIIFATIYQKFDALKHQLTIAKHDGAIDALAKVSQMLDEAIKPAKVAADTMAKATTAAPAGKQPGPVGALNRMMDGAANGDVQARADMKVLTDMFLADGNLKPEDIKGELLNTYAVRFHEATGRYAKLERDDNGLKIELSTNPFPETAAATPPAAAPAATAAEPATDPKLETVAQQRRRNKKAGKGEFTDDELRLQRNAKRKAARDAKKAAAQAPAQAAPATTTTTTIAPAGPAPDAPAA